MPLNGQGINSSESQVKHGKGEKDSRRRKAFLGHAARTPWAPVAARSPAPDPTLSVCQTGGLRGKGSGKGEVKGETVVKAKGVRECEGFRGFSGGFLGAFGGGGGWLASGSLRV